MKKLLTVLFLTFLTAYVHASESDAIIGKWVTEGGKSNVEIYKNGDTYSGKIIWLKEPLYGEDEGDDWKGKPKIDRNNPDELKRGEPIEGLNILSGFEYKGDNLWKGGDIYDPENGSTYSCKMTLSEDGKTLEVRGYIGLSLFGRTTVWTRAE